MCLCSPRFCASGWIGRQKSNQRRAPKKTGRSGLIVLSVLSSCILWVVSTREIYFRFIRRSKSGSFALYTPPAHCRSGRALNTDLNERAIFRPLLNIKVYIVVAPNVHIYYFRTHLVRMHETHPFVLPRLPFPSFVRAPDFLFGYCSQKSSKSS